MELQNTQSFDGTRSHRGLLYAILLSMIVLPLVTSLFTRTDDVQQTLSLLDETFWRGGFWADSTDTTFYFLTINETIMQIRLSLHSSICLFSCLILIGITITKRDKHLIPFTVAYSILTLFIGAAYYGDFVLNQSHYSYNRIMLWGAYTRALYGLPPIILYTAALCGFVFYLAMDEKKYRNVPCLSSGI